MKEIIIYTDGSSLGNPGRGGYGVVLLSGKKRKELSGGFRMTTNNRMEILAVIEGLKALRIKEKALVTIKTDSKLLVDTFEKRWIYSWEAKGWRKADKKPVLNKDLLEELLDLVEKYSARFVWVKAHVGNPENERCDELAKTAAEGSELLIDEIYEKENPQLKINIKSNSSSGISIRKMKSKFRIKLDNKRVIDLSKEEMIELSKIIRENIQL